jgi:polysaccharide deacetylase family sporulation protein PdaB
LYFITVSRRARQAIRIFVLLVCALAIARLGVAVTTGELPVMGRLEPIRKVPGVEDKVALTFDVSWGELTLPKVLAVLEEYDVRCTFFLSGPWAASHPELVAEIVADGHEIASHGHRHVNLTGLKEEEIRENLGRAAEAIEAASGRKPNLLRPPNGVYNDLVIRTAESMGYTVIHWGLDSHDWMNPGVNYIVKRVLERTKPGDVVLMHASDTCRQTDQALPAIIEGLVSQGFVLVTVSELLESGSEDG